MGIPTNGGRTGRTGYYLFERSLIMSRRKFSREFKLSAVQLVNHQGYSIVEAAKSLGVDPNCIRQWVEKFGQEAGQAPAGDGALQAELRRLRKENARLLMERDILEHFSPTRGGRRMSHKKHKEHKTLFFSVFCVLRGHFSAA